jgi:hypothetical protein
MNPKPFHASVAKVVADLGHKLVEKGWAPTLEASTFDDDWFGSHPQEWLQCLKQKLNTLLGHSVGSDDIHSHHNILGRPSHPSPPNRDHPDQLYADRIHRMATKGNPLA